MIFKEILDYKMEALDIEFDRLFDLIIKNQTHQADLLLVKVNAFYNPEVEKWDALPKLNPYVIGPDLDGTSESTHYEFISNYIKNNTSTIAHLDYLEKVKITNERNAFLKELESSETYSIQIEMLIYLKIWESTLFVKNFWQLIRLMNGSSYDWHLKIKKYSRDNESNKKKLADVIRDEIRELIIFTL